MKYGNELKVGIIIVAAIATFVLGIRYFEDIPLFSGTYDLHTEFDDAGGLIPGNPVRVNGVNVGSVQSVELSPVDGKVKAMLQVNGTIKIPEGSVCEVTGIDALGVVQLTVTLGPMSNPPIEPGGFLPSKEGEDLLSELSAKAPDLVNGIDSVLVDLETTLEGANALISGPQSELQALMRSARNTSDALGSLLREEQDQLGRVLTNVEELTGELTTLAQTKGDSLDVTIAMLNQMLTRVDQNLTTLESITNNLDSMVAKMDQGEGTVGKFINDPSVYNNLDSTLVSMNALLVDIRKNPVRYMRALRIVDLF